MNPRELCGRVEKVYVEMALENHGAAGIFDNQDIYVVNGGNYVGQECLVRFDLVQSGITLLLANFLTSDSSQPSNLPKEDYVLYALWKEGIFRKGRAPTMQEIEQYYNPGRKSHLLFVRKDSNSRKGRFKVNPQDHSFAGATIGRNIRDLPDPKYSARLVVAEGEKQLLRVKTSIEENGLVPILLEPLIDF